MSVSQVTAEGHEGHWGEVSGCECLDFGENAWLNVSDQNLKASITSSFGLSRGQGH